MTDPDEIRGDVLAKLDRTERHYKLAFIGAVVIEGAFLLAFFLLADMSNRTHLLLLLSTVATYSIVAVGLVALGAHMNRSMLRVIRALDLFRGR